MEVVFEPGEPDDRIWIIQAHNMAEAMAKAEDWEYDHELMVDSIGMPQGNFRPIEVRPPTDSEIKQAGIEPQLAFKYPEKEKVKTEISVLEPEAEAPGPNGITMSDVWGTHSADHSRRLTNGMLVARGLPEDMENTYDDLPQVCPVWGDRLPYKSVTVICHPDKVEEVKYWLEYVHGGGSIKNIGSLDDERVAIRSDYMCW